MKINRKYILYSVAGLIFIYLLFRVKMALARGVRNNNPGNIRPSEGILWDGQIGVDDHNFVIFDNKQNGLRATTITAYHYFTRHGIQTLNDFGLRWAPPLDNNGASDYGAKLAKQLGVSPNAIFDYQNRLGELVNAITHNEGNTALAYSTNDFESMANEVIG